MRRHLRNLWSTWKFHTKQWVSDKWRYYTNRKDWYTYDFTLQGGRRVGFTSETMEKKDLSVGDIYNERWVVNIERSFEGGRSIRETVANKQLNLYHRVEVEVVENDKQLEDWLRFDD